MRFKRIRQISDGVTEGDYYGYDTGTLYSLLQAIDSDIQLLNTDHGQQLSFDVICDPKLEDAVRAVVKEHGSEASVKARAEAKEKAEYNAPILAELDAIDKKRVRAVCECDTDYLKQYNDKAKELRAQIKK